jgi:hypothetical protein
MKNIFIILLSAATLNVSAQKNDSEKTLFGNGKLHLGYFISPSCQFGKLAGSAAVIPGLGAGIVINNKISLDLIYRQIVTENTPAGEADNRLYLDGHWGLLRCEYAINPGKAIHISFPIVAGIGEIEMDKKDSFENIPISVPLEDAIFANLEPGIALEINTFKYVKLNLSAGYRFVSDVSFRNLSGKDLSGVTFSAGLKIGIF